MKFDNNNNNYNNYNNYNSNDLDIELNNEGRDTKLITRRFEDILSSLSSDNEDKMSSKRRVISRDNQMISSAIWSK